MTCSASNFYRRNDDTHTALIHRSSQHPPTLQSCCNRAVCDAWSARFLRCLPVDCPQSMLMTSVRSMTHYSPCIRCRTHMIVHAHNSHYFHARVFTWTHDTLTFVLTILDHSRFYYSISADLGHTKSDRTRSLAR